ncbi:MAG: hypothetical protein AAF415_01285 [Pseudomonadota bacterium]
MKLLSAASLLISLAASGAQADEESETAQGFTPPAAKEGYSYPDCYCTDSQGERIELGGQTCLQIGSRQVWARCDMSLNNPTWRHDGEGCPSA